MIPLNICVYILVVALAVLSSSDADPLQNDRRLWQEQYRVEDGQRTNKAELSQRVNQASNVNVVPSGQAIVLIAEIQKEEQREDQRAQQADARYRVEEAAARQAADKVVAVRESAEEDLTRQIQQQYESQQRTQQVSAGQESKETVFRRRGSQSAARADLADQAASVQMAEAAQAIQTAEQVATKQNADEEAAFILKAEDAAAKQRVQQAVAEQAAAEQEASILVQKLNQVLQMAQQATDRQKIAETNARQIAEQAAAEQASAEQEASVVGQKLNQALQRAQQAPARQSVEEDKTRQIAEQEQAATNQAAFRKRVDEDQARQKTKQMTTDQAATDETASAMKADKASEGQGVVQYESCQRVQQVASKQNAEQAASEQAAAEQAVASLIAEKTASRQRVDQVAAEEAAAEQKAARLRAQQAALIQSDSISSSVTSSRQPIEVIRPVQPQAAIIPSSSRSSAAVQAPTRPLEEQNNSKIAHQESANQRNPQISESNSIPKTVTASRQSSQLIEVVRPVQQQAADIPSSSRSSAAVQAPTRQLEEQNNSKIAHQESANQRNPQISEPNSIPKTVTASRQSSQSIEVVRPVQQQALDISSSSMSSAEVQAPTRPMGEENNLKIAHQASANQRNQQISESNSIPRKVTPSRQSPQSIEVIRPAQQQAAVIISSSIASTAAQAPTKSLKEKNNWHIGQQESANERKQQVSQSNSIPITVTPSQQSPQTIEVVRPVQPQAAIIPSSSRSSDAVQAPTRPLEEQNNSKKAHQESANQRNPHISQSNSIPKSVTPSRQSSQTIKAVRPVQQQAANIPSGSRSSAEVQAPTTPLEKKNNLKITHQESANQINHQISESKSIPRTVTPSRQSPQIIEVIRPVQQQAVVIPSSSWSSAEVQAPTKPLKEKNNWQIGQQESANERKQQVSQSNSIPITATPSRQSSQTIKAVRPVQQQAANIPSSSMSSAEVQAPTRPMEEQNNSKITHQESDNKRNPQISESNSIPRTVTPSRQSAPRIEMTRPEQQPATVMPSSSWSNAAVQAPDRPLEKQYDRERAQQVSDQSRQQGLVLIREQNEGRPREQPAATKSNSVTVSRQSGPLIEVIFEPSQPGHSMDQKYKEAELDRAEVLLNDGINAIKQFERSYGRSGFGVQQSLKDQGAGVNGAQQYGQRLGE